MDNEYTAKKITITDCNGEARVWTDVFVQSDSVTISVAINEDKTHVITFLLANIISVEVIDG